MKKRILRILPFLCTFACLVLSCVRQAQKPEPIILTEPIITPIQPAGFQRGMWVRAVSIASPDSIARIVQIAEELNITDLYVQVVVAGYAYYRSSILPRSQYLVEVSGAEYDPLDSLLKIAQQRSIRVHAWVNAVLIWSLKNPPDSARHVYYTHPEWFIKDVHGKSMVHYTTEEWLNAGLEGLYLDPENIEVQQYIAGICGEISKKYPVVGVHLDFIRYPGTLWGLPNAETSALFAGIAAYKVRWLTLSRYPTLPLLWRWLVWHTWRANRKREENIQAIVEQVHNAVTKNALYPECLLTTAVFGDPSIARYRFDQNWLAWDNIINYPLIMSYTTDIITFKRLFDFAQLQRPDAILGIGMIWSDMEQEAYMQSEIVRQYGGAGICYFDFTSLDTMFDRTLLYREDIEEVSIHLIPDTLFVKVNEVFSEEVPMYILQQGKSDTTGQDSAFVEYLLSLSLSHAKDLQRMGLNRQNFVQYVVRDVACFQFLDTEVLPISTDLIEPPCRRVLFEFLPWGDADTATVKKNAKKIKKLTQQRTVYPRSLDHLAHAVFTSDIGEKGTWSIRTGIYVYEVIEERPGGSKVQANTLPKELLPTYQAWTVYEKARTLLAR